MLSFQICGRFLPARVAVSPTPNPELPDAKGRAGSGANQSVGHQARLLPNKANTDLDPITRIARPVRESQLRIPNDRR
jgi:hypothetical protein